MQQIRHICSKYDIYVASISRESSTDWLLRSPLLLGRMWRSNSGACSFKPLPSFLLLLHLLLLLPKAGDPLLVSSPNLGAAQQKSPGETDQEDSPGGGQVLLTSSAPRVHRKSTAPAPRVHCSYSLLLLLSSIAPHLHLSCSLLPLLSTAPAPLFVPHSCSSCSLLLSSLLLLLSSTASSSPPPL